MGQTCKYYEGPKDWEDDKRSRLLAGASKEEANAYADTFGKDWSMTVMFVAPRKTLKVAQELYHAFSWYHASPFGPAKYAYLSPSVHDQLIKENGDLIVFERVNIVKDQNLIDGLVMVCGSQKPYVNDETIKGLPERQRS